MHYIEINTTQNVRITYEVAHAGDRGVAWLIDLAIMGLAALTATLVASAVSGEGDSWIFYVIATPFFFLYTLVSEIAMKGQTLGKKAMSLQVVKLNGQEAQASDYFLRWAFRIIDIYLTVGAIAAIFVSTSKNGQRIGDLVAETTIIRHKPSRKMVLHEILSRYKLEKREVKFPQIRQMDEQEMLLVQKVLLRRNKYPNQAHKEIVNDLSSRLKKRLNISDEEAGKDNHQFLSLLIRDYITATR